MPDTIHDPAAPATPRIVPRAVPVVSLGGVDPDAMKALEEVQAHSVASHLVASSTHFYAGLQGLGEHISVIPGLIAEIRPLPRHVRGIVLEPSVGGNVPERGAHLIVQLTTPDGKRDLGPPVLTDDDGKFDAPLHVDDLTAADQTQLRHDGVGVRVRGDHDIVQFFVRPVPLRDEAVSLQLDHWFDPVPRSVVSTLLDIVSDIGEIAPPPESGGEEDTTSKAEIALGEGPEGITFNWNDSVRRFPYSVLVRLVEPAVGVVTNQLYVHAAANNGGGVVPLPSGWAEVFAKGSQLTSRYMDRLPVTQPISIEGFRDQVIGAVDGKIVSSRNLPMAGTLGLGYVVHLAQTWTPKGLSLGNLVYSLPLAPGEQQRIAIAEQTASQAVMEREALDVQETRVTSTRQDSSSSAVFSSAFYESVYGSSAYYSEAKSESGGVAGGVGGFFGVLFGVGASYSSGKATQSGSSSSSLDGSRHTLNQAAEDLHNNVVNQAAARRQALRTSIRIATESERETATTKVITNHNRTRALTMQYWEVLRHFAVTSTVEGVSLVCFVPLDLVRFLPAGQAISLDPASITTSAIRDRYASMVRHADVLRRALPGAFREGLDLAERFEANPSAQVQESGLASATLTVSVKGTFLPVDEVWAYARTSRRITLGPIRLDGPILDLPKAADDPEKAFSSRADLTDYLQSRRRTQGFTFFGMTIDPQKTIQGSIFLPTGMDPSEITGIELYRRMKPLSYQLAHKDDDAFAKLQALSTAIGGVFAYVVAAQARDRMAGVYLSASDLEGLLGGPLISTLSAEINSRPIVSFTPGSFELPPTSFPLPAVEQPPTLARSDVLKIEKTLQHVLRNSVEYSRLVWATLTPEERAIMLEGYTIGLPPEGLGVEDVDDPSEHVPLLNCVANRVLGFYGNTMIMPFMIPPSLSARLGGDGSTPLTTGVVQEALTRFHTAGFSEPQSHIVLPTAGVLGEAVLGRCPSAERIDLTRFWHWEDSEQDEATKIADLALAQPLQPVGGTAPATLSNLQPIITSVGADGTTAVGALAKELLAKSGTQADFDRAFTGLTELTAAGAKTLETADKARADALSKASELANTAITKAAGIVTATKEAQQAEDKKKKEAEQQKADKEKAAKDAAEAVLKANSEAYLAAAENMSSDEKALARARELLTLIAGAGGLSLERAARLLPAYKEEAVGGGLTRGSRAWLTALGLQG